MTPFDTETTGVDVDRDDILTACVAALTPASPAWQVQAAQWVLKPARQIPAGATAIHGLTTEWCNEHGTDPITALDEVIEALLRSCKAGIPIVGMNLAYDFTLLDRHARRLGLLTFNERFGGPPNPVIDAFVLDKYVDPYRKGSRKLEALCSHWQVRHEGAHDAVADALAAARVCYKIARENPELAQMRPDELHACQVLWRYQQASDLQRHFQKKDPDAHVDPCWPVCTDHPKELVHA